MTEWKDIPGWEGCYEVSSDGQVRNSRTGLLRAAKPCPDVGYPKLTLKGSGRKQQTFCVHRLVALAFLGPCPKGMEVMHRDGTRTNNAVGNLRYGTRSENVLDRINHGTHIFGERQHMAKLTEKDVLAIRADRRGARRLARVYGVSRQTLDEVKAGKTWRHLLPGGGPSLNS